ncbi:unnamed protein product [Chondrus crispus]|uniref:Uncharacterized protein n=1 Tax=Chondrus crispus TaxID=2769 RepID=R7Q510_CHOCR|nr:unnamed protein product [Chondrus crispus]CDF32948.1 unnamed protein product [Chondrus crispus]|eukprot:XP_005712751.1 unnamed protein product [Chondrus crispus]
MFTLCARQEGNLCTPGRREISLGDQLDMITITPSRPVAENTFK